MKAREVVISPNGEYIVWNNGARLTDGTGAEIEHFADDGFNSVGADAIALSPTADEGIGTTNGQLWMGSLDAPFAVLEDAAGIDPSFYTIKGFNFSATGTHVAYIVGVGSGETELRVKGPSDAIPVTIDTEVTRRILDPIPGRNGFVYGTDGPNNSTKLHYLPL